jgi:hypothetical protein
MKGYGSHGKGHGKSHRRMSKDMGVADEARPDRIGSSSVASGSNSRHWQYPAKEPSVPSGGGGGQSRHSR